MSNEKFTPIFEAGLEVSAPLVNKNVNDIPLIEAHYVLTSGTMVNDELTGEQRLDDKLVEIDEKIAAAAGAVNEETVKNIIKDNLNIENGESGANNLQQKPEIKDGTTEATTSWTSKNVQVQNWGNKNNGEDNSTIKRNGNDI
jgi:hypothetical protein